MESNSLQQKLKAFAQKKIQERSKIPFSANFYVTVRKGTGSYRAFAINEDGEVATIYQHNDLKQKETCECLFCIPAERQTCLRHSWKVFGMLCKQKNGKFFIDVKDSYRGKDDHHRSDHEKYANLLEIFLLHKVTKHSVEIQKNVELLESVNCSLCGEPLLAPASIRAGIGPICARRGEH